MFGKLLNSLVSGGSNSRQDYIHDLHNRASQNDSQAMIELGKLYKEGAEVEQDYQAAFSFFKAAIDAGSADGYAGLAEMYACGEGLPQNIDEGMRLAKEAADAGSTWGLRLMARGYLNGEGLPQDNGSAVDCLMKAANAGDSEAEFLLGVYYQQNPVLWGEEYQKAMYWFERASRNNHPGAMFQIGYAYDTGDGVRQDMQIATKYYEEAAKLGHAPAMRNLGICYYNGEGIRQDARKARYWLNEAARLGDEDAAEALRQI